MRRHGVTERFLVAGVALLTAVGANLAPSPIGPYQARATDPAPVAEWALDDGSGTIATDAIGDADGTVAGDASWITEGAAQGSGALTFDGVDDAVDVATATALEPGALTVTVWVRGDPEDAPADAAVILQKGDFDCTGGSFKLWVVGGDAAGIGFSFRHAGSNFSGTLSASTAKTTLWDGEWHLVGASIADAAGAAGSLSIDGWQEQVTSAITASPAIDYAGASVSDLRIGANPNETCAEPLFHGDIDDVRIYAAAGVNVGALMPPVATTTTLEQPPTMHPGEQKTVYAHVSPAPRMGEVGFQLDPDDVTTWVEPSSDGTAATTFTAPVGPTAYTLQARYFGPAPYVASSSSKLPLTIEKWPTPTTIDAEDSEPYGSVTLVATVSGMGIEGYSHPVGSVQFYETTSGSEVLIGTATLQAVQDAVGDVATSRAVISPSSWSVGTHTFVAKYSGDVIHASSNSGEGTVDVVKAATFAHVDGPSEAQENHPTWLHGWVDADVSSTVIDGTLSFFEVGDSTPLCTLTMVNQGEVECDIPTLSAGVHDFVATFSGNAMLEASTSDVWSLDVTADTVDAHRVGVQYATFYPVKDGYRDTDKIQGTRDESIGVTIKIYAPSGKRIKVKTIDRGTGRYSYAWNGRNSSGSVRKEGKYKVVQILEDSGGTTERYTSYINLSKKHLNWHEKTVAKSVTSVSAKGTAGDGHVKISSDGYVRLRVGDDPGWAGVGWQFRLPDATVYDTMKFQIYASYGLTAPPASRMGVQNFEACAYDADGRWREDCFTKYGSFGNDMWTPAWYSLGASDDRYRHNGKVRGMVSVRFKTAYVYRVRVFIRYATLGY